MSALETLAPDQRAVLQLILKQGRGYADLSTLLRIDEAAVRARAHAGLEALGVGGEALSPQRRAQVADWLLGQQDGPAREATLRYLGDSVAARRWAAGLRDRLAPLARTPLPEIPASANGHPPTEAADAAPAQAPAPPPAEPAPAAEPAPGRDGDPAPAEPADGPEPVRGDGRAPADAALDERPAAATTAPARPAPRPRPDGERERSRSSRIGGIILLVGVALLIAVLAIVLIGGGDDEPAAPTTPAATQSGGDGGQATGGGSGGTGSGGGQVLAQVNLNPTGAGGEAAGIGWVQRVDGRPMIAIQVANIAPNGEQDVYAAWLRAGGSQARFLGFVPSQVGRDRAFTVSSLLPRNVARFDEVLISREAITSTETPRSPGEIVLAGKLRLRG